MLNLIFWLDLFRLVRVRQRQEYHRGTSMIAGRSRSPNRTGVALFDDYAVVDRHSQSFFIRSLSRMVHTGSHGRQEYKHPVAYDDPKRESITCYFQVYQNVQENVHDSIYKIGDSELRQLPFTDILTQVNLTVSEDRTMCAWRRTRGNKKWYSKSFWVPTKTKTCYHHCICPSYRGRAVAPTHARWRNREASSPTRATKWWGSTEIN